MPFTPLHIPVAFAEWIISKKKLPLAPLVLANMAPDIEVPLIFSLSFLGIIRINGVVVDRLVLHSLIGGAVIVPIILLALYPLYAKIIAKVTGVKCPKASLREILIAGFIGGLSHVLLDAVHHPYNPLLFPFTESTINVLVIGDYKQTSIIVHLLFLALLSIIFVYGYTRYKNIAKTLAFTLGCLE